jgi:transposase InsO family protein
MIDSRKQFVKDVERNEESFTDICEKFGISRPTGYKWLERHKLEGEEGLENRSSARNTQDKKTSERIEEKILAVKSKRPKWGYKKIYGHLKRHDSEEDWPSSTTFQNILKRNGHVLPRKFRKRHSPRTNPLSHCTKPNDVWCADFKGWFRTKDNKICDPFTVTDAASRYLLHCSKLNSGKAVDVWQTLDKLFYEYGLPKYLRHDNGPPFGTSGVGRLSSLSVNLIKAGVTPEWIDPGKPYQNGRHERMHGTLQSECVRPLELTMEEQEMQFRTFISYFNDERPHEALGQRVPSDIYVRSEREWNGLLMSPEYGPEYIVKKVRDRGQISWRGADPFIGRALADEYIGLKEADNGDYWLVYYGPVFLGTMDHLGEFRVPQMPIRQNRKYKERCY